MAEEFQDKADRLSVYSIACMEDKWAEMGVSFVLATIPVRYSHCF